MRVLLVLLVPAFAHADWRFDAHAGGGLEGGLIQGKPRPSAVGELGVGATWFAARKAWGLGLVIERVERPEAGVPIGDELKLDALVRFTARDATLVGGVGAGVRRLAVAGDVDRPGSTVWGVDLLRMEVNLQLVRAGRARLDFYFAWTFGVYAGDVYGARFGDMPYPTRAYTTVASSYVVGLQTSLDTHP